MKNTATGELAMRGIDDGSGRYIGVVVCFVATAGDLRPLEKALSNPC
jgi:hypothetical protein